jgi:single-strand DNA-binding protein
MNQLNSLILEGNLVKDAVLTEPVPGFKKCLFTMGVNRYYKNKKNEDVNEASFFDVEAYNQMAEYCSKKATKGRGVRVVGRLKQDTWKDDSGKTVSKIYVVAEHIEYKPVKKTEENAQEKAEEKPAESATAESAESAENAAAENTVTEKVPVEAEAVF